MVHGGNLLRSDNCGFATYECRTVYDTELADNQWKRAEQSMACRTRENQLLMKQRDEAQDRIKQLEEAGDAMINEEYNKPRHVEAWRKAKEAKL
jgi:pantothenate synthetase